MKILMYPNDGLRQVCKPVTRVDATLRQQLRDMLALMYAGTGAGLAAPQVGIPLRMLVMNITGDPKQQEHEHVFINPVIRNRIGGRTAIEEGCLSLPGDFGRVIRSKRVKFLAYCLDGTEVIATWSGLAARVLQHEVDHLCGILFIDRLKEEE